MMIHPWLLFITTLQTVVVQGGAGYFLPNVTKPTRNEGLRITCSTSVTVGSSFYNFNLSPSLVSVCNLQLQRCIPQTYEIGQNPIYIFGINLSTVWVDILSLDRTRDQGVWHCEDSSKNNSETLNLTVYSSPVGLSFVSPMPPAVDLAESSVTLECKTNSCCYPEPTLIAWYYQTNSRQALLNIGSTRKMNSTGNCTQQEKIFQIIIELSRGTIFTGNIPMITTLRCGITHPVFDITQFSANSISVTFAVSLTHVVITGATDVTQGMESTFNCTTSVSRPSATVIWFIGNTTVTKGIVNTNKTDSSGFQYVESRLTFDPNGSTDHGKTIYCQAMTPFDVVTSAKVTLSVRVSLTYVNITGITDVTQGMKSTFICTTSISQPPASVRWFIDNTTVTTGIQSNMMDNTSLPYVESRLTFDPNGTVHHGKDIYCQAMTPFDVVNSTHLTLYVRGMFIPIFESNKPFPVREESLILSCFPATLFNNGSIRWYHPNGTELSRCYPIRGGLCNVNTTSYAFTANSTGSYAFIHSLNRTRDSGLWQCGYPDIGWLSQTVVVYASPVGVKLVPPVSPDTDLATESLTLKCQTSNCTFPAPSIIWYIYNMTSTDISPYTGSSSTLEPDTSLCTEQDAVYTSTLQLPRGTTFRGNTHLTMKFLCGLEHPTLGQKVEYSQHSNNVTFAAVFIPVLETNKPFPFEEESLILSCFPATLFNNGSIRWYHPDGTELSRCYPIRGGLCNINTTSYAFTANITGSYAFIHSLNRTRDSGLWQCAYPDIGWLNQTVVIYASPVGVKLVPSLPPVTDLGIESLTLKCQTFNCTFPAPNITWYIYNMTSTHISPYNGSSSTMEPDTSLCTEQEAVYTSTLQLPRGTTFRGNTPLTTEFLCGLEHPTLGQKVEYSQHSNNVTFAGPPQLVDVFHFNSFIEKQVEFNFKPGLNGGYNQTFTIEYRSTASPDSPWMNSSITDLKETNTYNGTYFVNVTMPPPGTYEYRMYSWNEIGRSPYSLVITIFIPEASSTSESHGLPVAGIAGGIIAGIVIILVVVICIFLWRRYQHRKKNEHDNDAAKENEESTRRNQIKASCVKQDVASGKEYVGIHFTNAEATQYLQLNDITLEENRNSSIRSPENDSYEKLHPYTNNDIQMYSSLKIPKTSKDSEPNYENSVIK